MDFTSRMVVLLGEMRREQNGVVADAMYDAGVRGVLNYGVSIPTIRAIAQREGRDHEFAKFLYGQQVRELRMAAVSIARAECVTADELAFWLGGNPSTELLDELAMRLISRTEVLDDVVRQWLEEGDAAARYAAMMSLARGCGYDVLRAVKAALIAVAEAPDDMRAARAAVVFLVAAASDDALRDEIVAGIGALDASAPAAGYLREEAGWQLAISN
ncbi:MAG: DNA alkylation repair protein [Alistipes sp.]|nr:DNA alkylation repair protein [Alistipes sp.]